MRKILFLNFVTIVGSVCFAVLPLIVAISAGRLAEANGCELHEGFANPCLINDVDRGDLLYSMGVFGWFSLVTIPFGIIGVAWGAGKFIELGWKKLLGKL